MHFLLPAQTLAVSQDGLNLKLWGSINHQNMRRRLSHAIISERFEHRNH